MGMIKCTECGKEMSDKASVCPNCGCPIEDIKAKLGEIEAEQEAKTRRRKQKNVQRKLLQKQNVSVKKKQEKQSLRQ